MRIISGGEDIDINILTYFKLYDNNNKLNEYIFYTKDSQENPTTIYVSNLEYKSDRILLVTPVNEILEDLKKIIDSLCIDNTNSFIFTKCEFQYLDIDKLEEIKIEENKVLKMKLTDVKFNILKNNKYLTYPFVNVTKSNLKKNDYIKNNKIAIIISSLFLILLYIGLVIYHFNSSESISILTLKDIKSYILFFQVNLSSCLIIKLSILTIILSAIAYNNDDNHPIILIMFLFLTLLAIYVIYYYSLGSIKFNDTIGSISIYKGIVVLALVHSIIIAIPYMIFKSFINSISNILKIKNFITFHSIFIVLFVSSFVGLTSFYNIYIREHVYNFLFSIM